MESVRLEDLIGLIPAATKEDYLYKLYESVKNIEKVSEINNNNFAMAGNLLSHIESLFNKIIENEKSKIDYRLDRINNGNRNIDNNGFESEIFREIADALGDRLKNNVYGSDVDFRKESFLQSLFGLIYEYSKSKNGETDVDNSKLLAEALDKERTAQFRLMETAAHSTGKLSVADIEDIIAALSSKISNLRLTDASGNEKGIAWAEYKKAYFEYMLTYNTPYRFKNNEEHVYHTKSARSEMIKKWKEFAKMDEESGFRDAFLDRVLKNFERKSRKFAEIINCISEELEIATEDNKFVKSINVADKEYRRTEEKIDVAENGLIWLQGTLTKEQQDAISRLRELNEAKRQKAIAETYRSEFALMQEQLRQYGTYQQQKLAITAEYAEKIRKAGSETEKETLGRERDSLLAGVKAQELKSNIDWGIVFGEFGGMFDKVIAPVLADAKAYVRTDEFKNSDHASQEALIDAIRQMEKSLGGASDVSFKKLGAEINDYQEAVSRLHEAQEEYGRCFAELEKAQKEYVRAQSEGTEAEKEAAQSALTTAEENERAASGNVRALQETADAAQRSVTNTATTLKSSMDGVVDGLQQLASGSLSGAYNGLITLGKSAKQMGGVLGEAFGKVADALEDVPILGWIVGIIDVFKEGISVVIGGLLDAVFNAVSGILDDVLSGDLFVSLGKSILSGVGKIFDAITWGGFSSWFGGGDSDKTLAQDIEYLTNSNKDLQKAIDNLAEKMEDGSVADAQDVYRRQKELLEQSMANTQEMMERSGAAYSNGFLGIGGDHSSNYKIDKGMSAADWRRISEITGKNITSAGAFFGLSSEDMAKVFNEANDLYSKIKTLADDGYKDAAQYMDDYIDYYRQIEELQDALREKLTGMSFSGLRDNFKSQLLDMESDSESFGENLDEMLFGTIVESLMSEKYSEMLKEWYKKLADAMADDGKLDDAELASLRSSYKKIVDDAIAERDAIADAMGYDPEGSGTSQSGKSGSFAAMSQDQGTKLEGLFVSAQMHLSSIDDNIEDVTSKWGAASDSLRKIEENTGRTADKVDELSDDIKKIIRDGIKTK